MFNLLDSEQQPFPGCLMFTKFGNPSFNPFWFTVHTDTDRQTDGQTDSFYHYTHTPLCDMGKVGKKLFLTTTKQNITGYIIIVCAENSSYSNSVTNHVIARLGKNKQKILI